ncbi:Arc1 protein [Saccharomycopsis crataegensis]|uniref:Arc1 protein n=1 Tax=Saccharomycopsis crataegensis TaxID=43959 RepID=A0AAV5QID1_9ASCO|nr:Arc1 protein [Saccharomycopsis crataegensis]
MSEVSASLKNLTISDDKSLLPESKFSVEQQALAAQWTTLVSTIQQDASFIPKLNDCLRHFTYVLGNQPTNVDALLFKAVFPVVESSIADEKTVADQRHIIRWIDLIQNTLIKLADAEKLKIPFNAELPVEVQQKPKKDAKKGGKEEPKKDDAAPAAAGGKPNGKPNGKPSPEELAKLKEEKAKAKAAKKAAAQKDNNKKAAPAAVVPSPTMIDLRVGFIEKAVKHPDADSLYVSTMNVGEDKPRTICSGLVKFYPLEEMQQRHVVVFCNLKKVKMRGIESEGMVLCSSDDSHGKVEFVNPPPGSKPGDKIFVEGYDGEPEKVLNPKKKIWEALQPHFTTDENFNVIYKEEDGTIRKLVNKKGEVFKNSTIVNAHIS